MSFRLRVGNAPCSWGRLEFDEAKGDPIGFAQMLDELVETGYTGTELGDWGFMPTQPAALREELDKRGLVMLGAFVPVALKNRGAHQSGVSNAVRTATLLAAVAREPKPFLVLADDNGTVSERTQNAGRIAPTMGLNDEEWNTFAAGANAIGRAVLSETGLHTVFHHHCAGYVETPDEIDRFLSLTDPGVINLVFDTGHYAFGGDAGVVAGMDRFRERIRYVHFKDFDPQVGRSARENGWDYFTSLRKGVFCELGKGSVDFLGVLRWLQKAGYNGYTIVEQDILPGMGTPKESARRNREFLRHMEQQIELIGARL
jgi:inosose dehydratase